MVVVAVKVLVALVVLAVVQRRPLGVRVTRPAQAQAKEIMAALVGRGIQVQAVVVAHLPLAAAQVQV